MSDPSPDPVQKAYEQAILDSPPAVVPLAADPQLQITIIPIDDSEAIADVMDAAAAEARRQNGSGDAR